MKKIKKYPNAINNWPEDDRPREKLLKYGEQTLSNAELLAIPHHFWQPVTHDVRASHH